MATSGISPIGEAHVRDMDRGEAQTACDEIRRGIEGVRDLVLDLHDRKGWAALGYESWRACVVAEFNRSESYLYRQLQAALIEREVSPIGETDRIPESQLRPLSALDAAQRREAWEEAKATAPAGKVTAKHVRAAVDKRLGKALAVPATNGQTEPPRKAVVNGVASHDPPDVAAARAAGRIAPNVVVEVTEPEEPEAAHRLEDASGGPPEESPPELPDDEWLDALPLSAQLGPSRRKGFRADALDFRRTEPARKAFQVGVGRSLKSNGEWAHRVRRLLKTDHPKHWLICPLPENGGCGGSGEVSLVGKCPKCWGRGYYLR